MQAATELFAIMSTVDPVSAVSGVNTGDQIDMYEFHEAVFIAQAGALVNGGSLHLDIWGGTASGTPSAVITGKQSTTSTTTATQLVIRVTSEEVAAQSYRYIWPFLTVVTTSVPVSLVGLGVHPRYGPADELDLSSVEEIIT